MKNQSLITSMEVASSLQPGPNRYDVGIAETRGLFLAVMPTGEKRWTLRKRQFGKGLRVTLGRFPTMDLFGARRRAEEAIVQIESGINPTAVKKENQKVLWSKADEAQKAGRETVKAVAEEWNLVELSQKRTGKAVWLQFNYRVFPAIGSKPIKAVSKKACVDIVNGMFKEGVETQARRVHTMMHRFFNWSVENGYIEINPMTGYKKPGREKKRNRWLSECEIVEVWRASEKDPVFGPIIQLLLLTGVRKAEIVKLRWSEIGIDNVIRLDGSRTKNGEPHSVPLSPLALSVLNRVPRRVPHKGAPDYIFTLSGKPLQGWNSAKRRLDRRIQEARTKQGNTEPMPHWQIHDLRATLATHAERLGVPFEVRKAIRGHVIRTGVDQNYEHHDYTAEVQNALNQWSDTVNKLLDAPSSKLLPLLKFG